MKQPKCLNFFRYRLLLNNYTQPKYMLPNMPDYEDAHKALKIVSDATDHVNNLMGQGNNFKQLVELLQSFNEDNIDIHPGQILIKEGVVQEQTRDGLEPRHLILLNDQLIVGKYS